MKLRVATFNVHHCEGADGIVDTERTAAVLHDARPDVIALQELDRHMSRSDRADQPADLSRFLGLDIRFFATLTRSGGEYGIGIAARTIEDARFVPLPRLGHEEPRGAIVAMCSGIRVVATHLSTHRRARALQLAALAELARSLDGPVLVMGDLNSGPRSLRPLDELGLRGAFGHATLRKRVPPRQIDHVLVSPPARLRRSWTVPTDASDHLPLLAEVEV